VKRCSTSPTFQAATFNLTHGFYKEAIAALRSALETMVFAVSCKLPDDKTTWEGWRHGTELSFKRQCDKAQKLQPLDGLERSVRQVTGTAIFAGEDGSGRNAWARSLYRRQSEYVPGIPRSRTNTQTPSAMQTQQLVGQQAGLLRGPLSLKDRPLKRWPHMRRAFPARS
jgi:hypothetical protein